MTNLSNHTSSPGAFNKSALDEGTSALTPEQKTYNRRQFARYRKLVKMHAHRTKLHVMIVEDQAFSRELLSEILRRNCTVRTCTNARDAWNFYLEEVPDIVFLDIGLPEIDGHFLANKIREVDALGHIIMVTASEDVYDIQMAKENRVDGFIMKPFNLQVIDECLARFDGVQKDKEQMEAPS